MKAHFGHPLTMCCSLSLFFPPKVEHIGLDEMISENVEVLEEAGQKSQKRRE